MLISVKDQIQYYADTISTVTGLDVEVVDTTLVRIAGTGAYAHGIGASIKQAGNLLKATLKGSKPLFIENPRKNEICKGCQTKVSCKELLSICAPISDGNTTYGAIELVCLSPDARERVIPQRDVYINFLLLLANSIADRVREKQKLEDISGLLDAMSEVVNMNDKGTLIYNAQEDVVYNNQRAQEILQKTLDSQFENFSITPTGITFSGQNEYLVEQEDRQQFVVGKKLNLKSATSSFSSVFVFDTLQSAVSHTQHGIDDENCSLNHIVGGSPLIHILKEQIRATATTNSSVLITGESGTGKELVARAVHATSDRAGAPFIAINCGAIPDTLLESELFGYVGGAFTGALRQGQIGKFELAEGGVLFLDEISSMPIYLQVKLLRVLQERTITRLGATRSISVDIRIIAATNDNIQDLMRQNMFRPDLFYRLNVFPIQTPPLRNRLDDLNLLINHFTAKYSSLFGKKKITLPASIMNKMRKYCWPGNIRELENAIEYLVNITEDNGKINEHALYDGFLQSPVDAERMVSDVDSRPVIPLKELEKQAIHRALDIYGDSTQGKRQVASSLGISLATLYRKLEQ
ncbi:MAG: sigma-54 interaction domain-containing protein [Halodesulfovibrio sp.]|uniref:sigma-54 interaction domain-containing protein n=1 Tax=Halodesulfovibrio sp. TaxID=1912772 RepID=UPI00359DB3AF